MNKAYKCVYNAVTGTWNAVSEIATSRGKTKKTIANAVIVLTMCSTGNAFAADDFRREEASDLYNNCSEKTNPSNLKIGNACMPGGSSVVIGDYAVAGKTGSTETNEIVAIGYDAAATGDQSVAIGANTRAYGAASISIGGDDIDSLARAHNPIYKAITGIELKERDYPQTQSNDGATAVGVQAVGNGVFSSAYGLTAFALGDASSAFGVRSRAEGKGASAFGAVSQAIGNGASAMGINSYAKGNNSVAIGSGNKSHYDDKGVFVGKGDGALTDGDLATAIGSGSEARADNATAIGSGSKAQEANSVAIGADAVAEKVGAVALGMNTKVEADKSAAIGMNSVATAATGNGYLTNQALNDAGVVAVGSKGEERRIQNVADGAVDSDAVTVAQLKSLVNKDKGGFALIDQAGKSIQQDLGKGIEIVGGLATDKDSSSANIRTKVNGNKLEIELAKDLTDLNSVTVGGAKITTTGFEAGNVSLTSTGINGGNQKITNIASGLDGKDVSALQGSDLKAVENNAVNVGDLSKTAQDLDKKITNVSNLGDSKLGGGYALIDQAGKSIQQDLGKGIEIVGGLATDKDSSSANIRTKVNGDKLEIELAKDLTDLNSVTVGGAKITTTGFEAGNVSLTSTGINGGNEKITNIASGVDNNWADVGGKLQNAVNAGDIQNIIGKGAFSTGNAVNIGGTGATNVHDAIAKVNAGFSVGDNSGIEVAKVAPGDQINFINGTNSTAVVQKNAQGQTTVQFNYNAQGIVDNALVPVVYVADGKKVTNKNGNWAFEDGTPLNPGQKVIASMQNSDGKVGATQLSNIESSIAGAQGDSYWKKLDNANKTSAGNAVNVGDLYNMKAEVDRIADLAKGWTVKVDSAASSNTNTGGAGVSNGSQFSDGEVVNPLDTVTFKPGSNNVQMSQKGKEITVDVNPDLNINSITAKAGNIGGVEMKNNQVIIGNTTVDNDGLHIKNGPSVTASGVDAGNKQITNVSSGLGDKELSEVAEGDAEYNNAVNVGDLQKALVNVGQGNQNLDNKFNDLGNRINALGDKINQVEKRADAGTAAAMAVAGLPQAYLPGKSMMAISGSTYRGQAGYAIGVSTISDNGHWVVKGAASGNSRGHMGATVGAGYQW